MNILIGMVDHHIWMIGQMIVRAANLDDQQLDDAIALSVPRDRR